MAIRRATQGKRMLDYTIIEPEGILRVEPSGALTQEDFTGLTGFADTYLARHDDFAGLLIESQSFPGWDSFAGFASHLRFMRDHERRIERIALVTDSAIAHVVEVLAKPFVAAQIRHFPFGQSDEALLWIKGGRKSPTRILVVLTSHDQLGSTGRKTGFWLEELAAPYYVFVDAGAEVTLASPKGGLPPLDPASDTPDAASAATRRFQADHAAQSALANTLPLDEVRAAGFDAVFYPGGHGPLWDLAEDPKSISLIEDTLAAGKPLAAVCHAPGAFRHAKWVDGSPLVSGRAVTGFANTEERAVGLSDTVPFLVEDMLAAEGGKYSKAADWQVHVVTDGMLITGQNPASSGPAAQALLAKVRLHS
jgi:putative intracellular protease/amidase